jgi:hypothetical protein
MVICTHLPIRLSSDFTNDPEWTIPNNVQRLVQFKEVVHVRQCRINLKRAEGGDMVRLPLKDPVKYKFVERRESEVPQLKPWTCHAQVTRIGYVRHVTVNFAHRALCRPRVPCQLSSIFTNSCKCIAVATFLERKKYKYSYSLGSVLLPCTSVIQ